MSNIMTLRTSSGPKRNDGLRLSWQHGAIPCRCLSCSGFGQGVMRLRDFHLPGRSPVYARERMAATSRADRVSHSQGQNRTSHHTILECTLQFGAPERMKLSTTTSLFCLLISPSGGPRFGWKLFPSPSYKYERATSAASGPSQTGRRVWTPEAHAVRPEVLAATMVVEA